MNLPRLVPMLLVLLLPVGPGRTQTAPGTAARSHPAPKQIAWVIEVPRSTAKRSAHERTPRVNLLPKMPGTLEDAMASDGLPFAHGSTASLMSAFYQSRQAHPSGSSTDGNFSFTLLRDPLEKIGQSLREIDVQNALVAQARELVPEVDAPREMPWNFVGDEIRMLALWFTISDQENPEVGRYIQQEHRLPALLYRIFISPFTSRHPDE